jgi:hypothetical protein
MRPLLQECEISHYATKPRRLGWLTVFKGWTFGVSYTEEFVQVRFEDLLDVGFGAKSDVMSCGRHNVNL